MNDAVINLAIAKRFAKKMADVENGSIQEAEYRILKTMRNEEFSILDIGANCGISSYIFLKEQPLAFVYAFEPNIRLLPFVNEVAQKFPSRLKVFGFGLGNSNHSSILYVPTTSKEYYSGLGTLNKKYADYSLSSLGLSDECMCFDSIPIVIKKGDEVALPLNCRMIKIDVEGGEYECLEGLFGYIKRCEPILLVETLYNRERIFDLLSELYCVLRLPNQNTDIHSNSRNTLFVPRSNNWKKWIASDCLKELYSY